MDEPRPHVSMITERDEQVEAIKELIELIESGQASSGAVRLYTHDGRMQEIVFGDTPEDRQLMLEQLRAMVAKSLH